MIRDFYKYVRNRYLENILIRGIDMNDFVCAPMSIKMKVICFYSLKIQLSEKDEPQSQWLIQIIYFVFI